MADPLILSLRQDEKAFQYFDELRQQHFPPERNYIRAHLTLFHHLPGDRLSEISAILSSVLNHNKPMDMRVAGLRLLGGGVAFRIDCTDLANLHANLSNHFRNWLTPQDQQKLTPHVTIQNKVSPPAARSLHDILSRSFVPFNAVGIGCDLWHYRGGPWDHAAYFAFTS